MSEYSKGETMTDTEWLQALVDGKIIESGVSDGTRSYVKDRTFTVTQTIVVSDDSAPAKFLNCRFIWIGEAGSVMWRIKGNCPLTKVEFIHCDLESEGQWQWPEVIE